MAISQTSQNKSLESTWALSKFKSICGIQPKCVFAQESNPCLLPNENSPTIWGNTPTCCLYFSEPWHTPRIFHQLKFTPNLFSIEEKYDFAWEIYSSTYLVRTTTAKLPLHKLHKHPGSTVQSNMWMNTSPNVTYLSIWTLSFSHLDISYNMANKPMGFLFLSELGLLHVLSIAWKALQGCSAFRPHQIGHGNAFFAQVGKSST